MERDFFEPAEIKIIEQIVLHVVILNENLKNLNSMANAHTYYRSNTSINNIFVYSWPLKTWIWTSHIHSDTDFISILNTVLHDLCWLNPRMWNCECGGHTMKYNMIFQLLEELDPLLLTSSLFKGQLYFNLTRKRIIIILILKVWKLRQREV